MQKEQKLKLVRRQRRIARIRARVVGSTDQPRLSVRKTNRNIFAQLIDDTKGLTLLAVSTLKLRQGTKTERAAAAGEQLAKQAAKKHITKAVFDRRGAAFHGRLKAFAQAAAKAGLRL